FYYGTIANYLYYNSIVVHQHPLPDAYFTIHHKPFRFYLHIIEFIQEFSDHIYLFIAYLRRLAQPIHKIQNTRDILHFPFLVVFKPYKYISFEYRLHHNFLTVAPLPCYFIDGAIIFYTILKQQGSYFL